MRISRLFLSSSRIASVHSCRQKCLSRCKPSLRSFNIQAGEFGSSAEKDKNSNDNVNTLKAEIKSRMEKLADNLKKGIQKSAVDEKKRAELGNLRKKIDHAISVMQEGLIERDTEVRLMLLAALSGEHILFIGPPGTAKSEVGRRLNKLIQGTYFERLLTRFSVPEELFGPLSMRALEEDRYVRQTTGYLPEARVAFIDEVFKANSAILNTLLTLMNERLFDNGAIRVKVPLLCMVGASNELPESEELDALYDRFLVRRFVKQVSASGVASMLTYYTKNEYGTIDSDGRGPMGLSTADIATVKQGALKYVTVPMSVIQLLTDLRTYLQEKLEPAVYVSDRRLVKSIQLLQVAAYCNGRDSVSEYDCMLLQHLLWQKPEQADKIADWVLGHLSVDDGLKQVNYLLAGLFSRACRSLQNAEKVAEISSELSNLREVLVEKYTTVGNSLEAGFPVVHDNLFLGPEERDALETSLGPKLSRTRDAVMDVLKDITTLEVSLKANSDPVTLANLMPKYWADFIRNSSMEEVMPIGTRPLAGRASYVKPIK